MTRSDRRGGHGVEGLRKWLERGFGLLLGNAVSWYRRDVS